MDWHASPTNTRWQSGPASASSSRHCRPFVSWNSSTSTRSKRSRTSAPMPGRARAARRRAPGGRRSRAPARPPCVRGRPRGSARAASRPQPDLVLEAGARLLLRRRRAARSPAPAASLFGADEREQLAIARRPGEQRLDARQTTQVAHRLRARVARERRAGRRGRRRAGARAATGPPVRGRQQRGAARRRRAGARRGCGSARASRRRRTRRAGRARRIGPSRRSRAIASPKAASESTSASASSSTRISAGSPASEAYSRSSRAASAWIVPTCGRAASAPAGQRALEAQGELARSRLGVGDDEHALGCRARLERRAHALDHERRLARARAGRDDDLAARLDRRRAAGR